MDDIKQEFWGDLQVDLYTANTAVYLANQSLEQLISLDGRKAHKPILSHAQIGTYTPHSEISFTAKTDSKNTLEVDTFQFAAEDIDITEQYQSPYDLLQHSLTSIRRGLMNAFEQKYLSEITNAGNSINSGTAFELATTNVLDVFQEAGSKLGSFDVPRDSSMRAVVLGPHAVEVLRRAKSERESGLGDSVLANGVIGPWHGWTVVENNNLPWSASLKVATKPTDGDTVTISGVTFTFKTTLGTAAGNVLIGSDAAAARANLKLAVEGGSGAGTNYVDISPMNAFILRRKRYVKCTSAEDMAFTGNGDISVSETLTAAADVWSAQQQSSIFMIRGAIDAVMQFLDLDVGDKEKGFAKLPKGIIGMGTEMFPDGQIASVKMVLDASNF
jgi:hypothetical protein